MRRLLSTTYRKLFHTNFAVVFDIDGVLIKGNHIVPEATDVLNFLKQHQVPFIFLTNGGGVLEKIKAEQLSKKFGVDIAENQICLSHTPMKLLLDQYRNDLVMVVGKGTAPQDILKAYGFQKVVSVDQYHGQHPEIYVDFRAESKMDNTQYNEPIKAVLCLNDPLYWGRELQILCDVARSDGIPGNISNHQVVPFYFSGPDFLYATSFKTPRFGSGAFVFCLEKLYSKLTDKHLEKITLFGKPEVSSYRYVENILEGGNAGEIEKKPLHRIYAIGDNPLTDIRGANNAGGKWRSVLVRSGVWNGDMSQLSSINPHFICDNVSHALEDIVEHENSYMSDNFV